MDGVIEFKDLPRDVIVDPVQFHIDMPVLVARVFFAF
jgi:hypothetical protein